MSQVVIILLLAVFTACGFASVVKRQLPAGLTCSPADLTVKLESFPLDAATGEPLCKRSTVGFTLISPEDYVDQQDEVFQHLQQICSEDCLPSVVDLVDDCFPSFRTPLGLACASNGIFPCWEGPVRNNGSTLASYCLPIVESNFASCPENCKRSIEEIRASHGCCVNNVFNTSVFGTVLEQLQVANGQLWDVCEVDRVSFCSLPEVFVTEDNGAAHDGPVSVFVSFQVVVALFGLFL